ncbi:hypothetical protein BX666DRAFT_1909965 [Dichotomocladium elegans]|nr:hypothetical protein BX666DRAFT_1909965 [Dichotomocladium elegans]
MRESLSSLFCVLFFWNSGSCVRQCSFQIINAMLDRLGQLMEKVGEKFVMFGGGNCKSTHAVSHTEHVTKKKGISEETNWGSEPERERERANVRDPMQVSATGKQTGSSL